MNPAEIVAALIPIFLQAEPALVADIGNLMHGNPQQQGETDAAYTARIVAQIKSNTVAIDAADDVIQS